MVGATAIQLNLQSLKPLSVAGCYRLQLGAAHWATSIELMQVFLIIDPTNSGILDYPLGGSWHRRLSLPLVAGNSHIGNYPFWL